MPMPSPPISAPPILLLDEVAAHLDGSRRAALYAALTALGGQSFLTGTGPDLFETLAAESLALHDHGGISRAAPSG